MQKSSSPLRFQSNTGSHSKNKLINSLINKKLFEEKQQVLTRYVKLAKKASDEKLREQNSQFQIRKRASSLKNLNLSMEKIKQSLTFNSINANKQLSVEAHFILSRQYHSPIISQQQVTELNELRQKSGLFEVKLTSKDKAGLVYSGVESDWGNRKEDWMREVQQSLDNQLWLPGLPHVQMLIENLQENGKEFRIVQPNFDELPIVKSPVFNEHGNGFKPIKSSNERHNKSEGSFISKNAASTKLIPVIQIDRKEVTYDFKKYHKDDYLALEEWFEMNVKLAHKRYNTRLRSDSMQTLDSNISKQLLNTLYTLHIAGVQELIRLSYVEAWQKALVMEKLFWSLVRLFTALIEEQHKLNYSEYKVYQKEIRELRQIYEDRCTKLEIMMVRAQAEARSSETLRQRLSLAYVTYSRVNTHLYQQLEFTAQRLFALENSFNFINMKFMRLIDLLAEENRIKTIANEFETVYYLKVGQNDKLEELVRVQTPIDERKKLAKKAAESEIKHLMERMSKSLSDPRNKEEFQKAIIKKREEIEAHFQSQKPSQVFQTRIGERISNVEHELNKYWLSKQQSLKIKQITHEQLLNYTTTDVGTSTAEKFSCAEFGCQFPEQMEKSFGEFLKDQIEKERSQHKKEITKQEDLYVSLKELYEESYEKVRGLENKKAQLSLELENAVKLLEKRDDKIVVLQAELNFKTSDLAIKTQTIETLLKEKRQLQKFISQQAQSGQELERKFSIEIENSQTLVRNNFKMKEKLQTLNDKLGQLQTALQQKESKKGQIEFQLHNTESERNDLSEKYERLHKNLLKIGPSVDSFLDFKRYDRQSIVIASVKKDLEKYFPEYFCKDSDVFVTKG